MSLEQVLTATGGSFLSGLVFLFNLLRAAEKAHREAETRRADKAEADLSKLLATHLELLGKKREQPSHRPPISGTR